MQAFRFPLAPALVCAATLAAAAPAGAATDFRIGLVDPDMEASPEHQVLFDRLGDSGAEVFRINAYWNRIAPDTKTKPDNFQARAPGSARYDWGVLDAGVRKVAAEGVEPLLTVVWAPKWAEGLSTEDRERRIGDPGTYRPDPDALEDFAVAIATRYSGSFADPANPGSTLPRVRMYQAWNEQNFGQYLRTRRRSEAPVHYVRMLNAFYDGIKSVSRRNTVATGGLGPYGHNGFDTDYEPQLFMRRMLCLKGVGGRHLRPAGRCRGNRKPRFDAWAQHPYALAGTPRSAGINEDAASMGNLPDVRRTLDKASAAGHTNGRKPIWMTEIGWFSNPPGHAASGTQLGKPLPTHAHYLSEAAYRAWRSRVNLFLWFGIRDYETWPGGLYFRGGIPEQDEPKPALQAFRLPFYADVSRRGLLVWATITNVGRTTLRIERESGDQWKRVGQARTTRDGILFRRLGTRKRGTYRAVAVDGPKAGLTSYSYPAQ